MASGESSWRGARTSDSDSRHAPLQSSGEVSRANASAVPRRTRQLQADGAFANQTHYLPPALREGASGQVQEGAQPPHEGSTSNARGRARAGTLPSSWGSADGDTPIEPNTRFASPLAHRMSSLRPSTGASAGAGEAATSGVHGSSRLSTGPNSSLGSQPSNSGGRLATLRNSAFEEVDNSNRLRSGSMTTAMSGLGSNAFGPSLFASTWSQSNASAPASRRSPMLAEKPRGNTVSFFDDYEEAPQPPGARPSIVESLDGSENVQTLDYLGLADARNSVSNPGARSPDDHRASSHFVTARNRASTLASAPRNAASTAGSGLGGTAEQGAGDNNLLAYGDEEVYAAFAREHGIDPTAFAAAAAAAGLPAGLPPQTHQSHAALAGGRLRAGTVAALGGPGGRQRVEQELLRLAAAGQFLDAHDSAHISSGSQERREGLMALGAGKYAHAPLEGFPHVSVSTPPADTPGFLSRSSQILSRKESVLQPPSTPGAEHRSSTQTPGRSLWIGQLSAGTTGQELMQIFAPYGAIESLRLLPEKECGFVNFVEAADAIRAKDDIMQRQGGRVGRGTGPNGAIRIGFGKIDSAPTAPPLSSGYSTPGLPSRGLNSPRVETPGLGEGPPGTPGETGPTRALWVGSIPISTTNSTLMSIFQPFGPIESVRVLSHKNCGFINFERVDDAVLARKMLNGRDVLGSETGAMRIGFAKVPVRTTDDLPSDPSDAGFAAAVNALSGLNGATSAPASVDQQLMSGSIENYRSNLVADLLAKQHRQGQAGQPGTGGSTGGTSGATSTAHARGASLAGKSASSSIVPSSDKGGVPLPVDMRPRPAVSDLQLLMRELSADDPAGMEADVASVANARPPASYYTTIPLVSEQSASRRFDTSRLRELRKQIESTSCTQEQVDTVAAEHMDAIVDLAHDYIGNTVVQKLFERCSERIKHVMLERIAPHLAMIGIHKNGTWAAQKIIETSGNPAQISIIAQNLRPYVPPLLLDQFGNYVVQCCLHWNSTFSDFIFDAMTDRCWEIAQGRFGARSMRACLESSHVTSKQRKKVAISVILNSVPLATSPNGALLLTWLLDTSGLPGRYRLLAPRFAPYLANLCTHKLASLTVLRIICQKSEPEASQTILNALFASSDDDLLREVITDQVHGSQFMTKVLAWVSSNADHYAKYSEQVKRVVVEHSLIGVPAYRKLVEDLGLMPGPAPGQVGGPGVVPRNDLSLPAHLGPFMASNSPNLSIAPHLRQPPTSYSANAAPPAQDLGAMLAHMHLQNAPPGGFPLGPAAGAPIRMDGLGPPTLAMNTRPDLISRNSYPAHLRSPQSDAFNPWSNTFQEGERNERYTPQQTRARIERQPPSTPPRTSQNSYATSRR